MVKLFSTIAAAWVIRRSGAGSSRRRLWARGVSRIDTVFLSHADQDHYDGLPDLLDRFPINEVRLPPEFAGVDNPMAVQLIDQVSARGISVRPITAPESWYAVRRRVRGVAPVGRVAPGDVGQRTQSRARRRLPRAPSALDG